MTRIFLCFHLTEFFVNNFLQLFMFLQTFDFRSLLLFLMFRISFSLRFFFGLQSIFINCCKHFHNIIDLKTTKQINFNKKLIFSFESNLFLFRLENNSCTLFLLNRIFNRKCLGCFRFEMKR